MGMLSFAESVESLYKEYGKYHTNGYNQAIHIVCVPLILSTLVSLGMHCPLGEDMKTMYQPHVGLFFLIMILGLYLKLDFWSGLVASVIYSCGYFAGNHYYLVLGSGFNQTVMWVQIVCWGLQFIGHGVFENRRPALLDNLLLTLAAPLFVVLEVMMIFGYKSHLHDLIKNKKN